MSATETLLMGFLGIAVTGIFSLVGVLLALKKTRSQSNGSAPTPQSFAAGSQTTEYWREAGEAICRRVIREEVQKPLSDMESETEEMRNAITSLQKVFERASARKERGE